MTERTGLWMLVGALILGIAAAVMDVEIREPFALCAGILALAGIGVALIVWLDR